MCVTGMRVKSIGVCVRSIGVCKGGIDTLYKGYRYV